MRFLLAVIGLFAVYFLYHHQATVAPENPVSPSLMQQIYTPPLQGPGKPEGLVFGNGRIDFRASYDVTARILSRKDYGTGIAGKLAPMDLALGWGPMSSPGLAEKLSVTQGGRFYHYKWSDTPPLDPAQIVENSANTHIVAANDDILRQLKRLKKYQIVRLQGWLIDYKEPNGFSWQSSMTRSDSGWGACELLYVEHVTAF